MSETTVRPGQEHYVAPLDTTPLAAVDAVDESTPSASLWGDAWKQLRRRPLFIVPSLIIVLLIVVALFPSLFTSVNPRYQELSRALEGGSEGHPLGFTRLGTDVYARLVHGARASISVGLITTAIVVVVGGVVGALAGFFGGWIDALLSRLVDMFFALPLILGAIVMLQALQGRNVWTVALTLSLFGWPQVARIMRSSVLQVRGNEYVTAAKSLGLGRFSTLARHVLPNALGPVIVIATISLGTFIAAEATLSFLGIGLPSSVVSWGGDISNAVPSVRTDPWILLWPSIALSVTVLSFLMLGDALRDALDPKGRTR
ncbi:ABC transporter permease [Paenibacillus sp. TRM 82003]|uniref:ABC transporter permease n=1 Tax=Kineococcus sp. TRM81007 TaxID=2925831 RepID=UPI001F5ACECA|nr:ABC transporter permease [Kineococcus sp. TRM81007]MCI2239153.1 ABC transporter permease [Kineococcus sp. TRM81007]MCI3924832.1 ABC transporter permease [Paenibacillus sp. TRM 82003]